MLDKELQEQENLAREKSRRLYFGPAEIPDGEKIKALRYRFKLTQKDLSKIVGISQQHICELERGTYKYLQDRTRERFVGLEHTLESLWDSANGKIGEFRRMLGLKETTRFKEKKMTEEDMRKIAEYRPFLKEEPRCPKCGRKMIEKIGGYVCHKCKLFFERKEIDGK